MPKILELTLNQGVDPRSGKQLGPATADPRSFASVDELYEAFKQQCRHFFGLAARVQRVANGVRREVAPVPFNSSLQGDCIGTGRDVHEGPGLLPQLSDMLCDRGHQNVADSLVAIRKLVFEENKISMAELLNALKVDFAGAEHIRRMLTDVPKYGNDDDEADEMMADVFAWTAKEIRKETNPWGFPMLTDRHGTAYHYFAGKTVGATPDGRKAWTAIADAGASPMTGVDLNGPTAVLNSAGKLDHLQCGVAVLNQKFTPTVLQTREQLWKIAKLIKTYFDDYGSHIQFNVVDRQTLLAAKNHPELYRNLLIRVAGYSAFFVELDPEIQDEIIARTEQAL